MKVAPPPAETAWRDELEAWLLALPHAEAARVIQLMRESRAAWALLLPPAGGARRALFLGDARSGTPMGLARLGWRVTVQDPETAAFAARRGAATRVPVTTEGADDAFEVTAHTPPTTPGTRRPPPFLPEDGPKASSVSPKAPETAPFDLVLLEDDASEVPVSLELAAALSSDLVACTVDNPFGYKRSSGFRADFRVTSPMALLRALAFKRYKSLGARRRRMRERVGVQEVRAVALYPDRRDFAHVVDWERGGPDLTIGPAERRNRIKILGRALGLFPVFAPSFGLFASRAARRERLVDAVLAALGRQLGGQPQAPEQLVATRGNSALVFTRDWVVRFPLGHRAEAATRQNFAGLEQVHELEAGTPEPLFLGEVEVAPGVRPLVGVEARLDGFGAGQLAGRPRATGRLARELGRTLARLPRTPHAVLDEQAARALFGPRFAVVRKHAADPGTIQALHGLEAEVVDRATGLSIPRIVCHRDLRPKHVVVDRAGRGELAGIVDWSCLEVEGPPLFDLFHFLAQEWITRPGWKPARVWREWTDRDALPGVVREVIEAYERALELPPEWLGVVARAYPVLFGAMAEEHWDFSRPLWLKRMFGIE